MASVRLGDHKLLVLIVRCCYRDTYGARILQPEFELYVFEIIGIWVTFTLNLHHVPARYNCIL